MYISSHEEAIIAQCTPSGAGALALIRLCGKNAISIADKISVLVSKKKLSELPTHTIHYGSIVHNNESIDKALFLLMKAPHTFTGQDTVEISCHNNPFIIESIISVAIHNGARLAQHGEFTQRAVYNNKMDLLQAEAINELIHANTQHVLKQSMAQLEGTFSKLVESIEKKLLHALALSEASFEFLDEEHMEFGKQIEAIIYDITNIIDGLKKGYESQKNIREGVRIALIGTVNAGKSSLFNALLKKNRSIVTNTAGTTRDVIEAGIYNNGIYWTIIDTAGIRKTNDEIEKEGVTRSFKEADLADVILLVQDGSRSLSSQEELVYHEIHKTHTSKCIVVQSKADLPSKGQLLKNKAIKTIHGNEESIEALKKVIHEKIKHIFKTNNSSFLLNQRHGRLLEHLSKKLQEIALLLRPDTPYELVSYHLTEALSRLSELTGKTISEAGMDAIFRNFCIGK